ncbi:MAG: chromosomal replication initiator protein DnaA [Clostridia bacterium]|nr:chromosomal replication initiator protein DnaA [Clostridia bacterium]
MNNNAYEIWKSLQTAVEPLVSALTFDIWIKPLTPLCVVNDYLIVRTESNAAKTLIEKQYLSTLNEKLKEAYPNMAGIEIITPVQEADFQLFIEEQQKEEDVKSDVFVQKYTFDNFVVGKSNALVAAAAKAAAENLGTKYNPLFIYGGVGLGKTHLLHAIGNYLSVNKPQLKCVYVSSEKFTNDLIEALRDSKKNDGMKRFRSVYRNADVLMIDDIQFIAKTESTQEEVFHTFNALYFASKQIVITSDRPPREIRPLEERLRTRFEGGLTADIGQPDFEMRVAILKTKARQMEIYDMSDEVLGILAQKVQSNIRELEGLLTKVVSFANLTERSYNDVNLVNDALKDYKDYLEEIITIDNIVDTVCAYSKVSKSDLLSKKKTKEIVEPRQICIYLVTDLLSMPLTAIGEYFGGRDHTTVIHARNKVQELIADENSQTAIIVKDIKNSILQR